MEDLETTESTLENLLMRQDEEICLLKKRVQVLETIVQMILEGKFDDESLKNEVLFRWKRLTK